MLLGRVCTAQLLGVPYPLESLRLDFSIMAFWLMEGVPLTMVLCVPVVVLMLQAAQESHLDLCASLSCTSATRITVTTHTLKDLTRGWALC